MTTDSEVKKRTDLTSATIADLVHLFETTQLLEAVLLGAVNNPKASHSAQDMIDLMFINEVSTKQLDIIAELRSRTPQGAGEVQLRGVALACWDLLDGDFRAAEEGIGGLYLDSVIEMTPSALQ